MCCNKYLVWGLQKGIREDFFQGDRLISKLEEEFMGKKRERKLLLAIDALLLKVD